MAFGKSYVAQVRNGSNRLFVGPITKTVVVATGWQVFVKPPNASFLSILAVGGGAGGGCGINTGSGNNKGGGGGGGSGAAAKLVIAAANVPSVLYVLAGNGGSSDPTASVSGGGFSGGPSIVSDQPIGSVAANRILLSGSSATTGAVGGDRGDDTFPGAGGAGESVAVATGCAYAGFGAWTAFAGTVGADAGALGSAGNNSTINTGLLTSGGAGGGSTSAGNVQGAGGNVTGGGRFPDVIGGAAGGGHGNGGFQWLAGTLLTGGAGGGSAASPSTGGPGGAGGSGALGCGGGGGGGNGLDATEVGGPGSGGVGGPGFVFIQWW